MSRRLIIGLILLVAALTGCARPVSAPSATAGYRLFIEQGYNRVGPETITVLDSGTGSVERELPLGTPALDWSRYYIVTTLNGSARLAALDPASGRTLAQTTIPSGFTLPQLGFEGPSAGLSPNGQWLALTSHSHGHTSFLVGSTSLTHSFTPIALAGDFEFDALSDDGTWLYLVENLSQPNHYQVRLYDVAKHALWPQVVADKQEPKEPMYGFRGDSVAHPAGSFVFTVYARDSAGAFIHALPLDQPYAYCIDLPKDRGNGLEQQFLWSLAISADGSRLYGVNGDLAEVAVINTLGAPKVERSASVALKPSGNLFAGLVTPAEAKGARIGGAALSGDGRTLFTIDDTGVLAIDTATLKPRNHVLQGETIVSMHLSTDGKWLYAADAGAGKVWQINPASGALAGQVKGVDNPWAILWAEPK